MTVQTAASCRNATTRPTIEGTSQVRIMMAFAQRAAIRTPVGEEVILFERIPAGLRQLRVLTTASFVRLRGRYGFAHALGEPQAE